MQQYFSENVNLVDDPQRLTYEFKRKKLIFETNSGLFSKGEIDKFSAVLVDNIEAKNFQSILDLGCGYGFIGIALASINKSKLTFIDITSRACEYTELNCQLNKVENYQIIQSDGIQTSEEYDLITLNPPIHAGKEVIYRLYKESLAHLNKEGCLYIVLHKKHGAKSTIEYFKTISQRVEVVSKKKSLYIIRISK